MVLQNEVTQLHPILGIGNAIISALCTNLLLPPGPGQHLPTLSKRFGWDLAGLLLKVNTQIPNNIKKDKRFTKPNFTLFLVDM